MKSVDVVIAGAGSGVIVELDDKPTPWRTLTDQRGIASFVTGALPDSIVTIGPVDGFKPYRVGVTGMPPTNHQLRIGGVLDPTRPQDFLLPGLEPRVPPMPHLEFRGRDAVGVNGERRVFNGTDQFLAFRQFRDGGPQALEPAFQESAELGFDLWRVLMMGSKAQNGVLELRPSESGFYDDVYPFVQCLNAHGITPLAPVFVDTQDIMQGGFALQAHWNHINDCWRRTAVFPSGGNEWPKNGFNPEVLSDPGMLWSRGSARSDEAPFKPCGSFLEFHPRRDMPKALMDAAASPLWAWYEGGYPQIPWFFDEPPRFGTDGSGAEYADPVIVAQFARIYSALAACAVFHNRAGQSGRLMDGPTRVCAAAWTKGMTL